MQRLAARGPSRRGAPQPRGRPVQTHAVFEERLYPAKPSRAPFCPAAARSRDARTRAALLDAARWLLSRRGYDQLGTREIGARAGVDAALVQRYFDQHTQARMSS
ncbi:helix-turn-helix domain-containing protein [Sorangium sp. So ce1078]|uniref:helix-turn-helix domain-containing protein n=1 Tax=Sorangium sp. So ce1078 TaxID=3133329 RepID=UPI003F5F51A8